MPSATSWVPCVRGGRILGALLVALLLPSLAPSFRWSPEAGLWAQTTGEGNKEAGRARLPPHGGDGRSPGGDLPTPPDAGSKTPDEAAAVPGGAGLPGGGPQAPGSGNGREATDRRGERAASSPGERWAVWWERSRFTYLPFASRHHGAFQDTVTGAPLEEELKVRRGEAGPVLRRLARSSSPEVRREALLAISLLQDPEALRLLRDALLDPVLAVSDTAILGLGVLHHPQAVHALLHVARGTEQGGAMLSVSSVSPYRQGLACLALALGSDAAAARLLSAIALDRRETDEVREYAAWALGRMPSAATGAAARAASRSMRGDATLVLIELAQRPDENPYLRGMALLALGHLEAREALPVGLTHLLNGRACMARPASLMLGLIGLPGDTDLAGNLATAVLRSPDVELRSLATLALGLMGGAEAARTLEILLLRGRSQLTPWAAIGAGLYCRQSRDASLSERLVHRLEQTLSVNDRSALALALGIARMKEARPALAKTLSSTNSAGVASYAALALGMVGCPEDFDLIARRAQQDRSPLFLYRAALGVAALDHPDSLGLLLTWLRRETNPSLGSEIALSVAHLGRVEAAPVLLDILDDQQSDPVTLANTARALGLLLRADEEPAFLTLATHTNDYDEPASAPYAIELLR
ncbi:MAG: HEAT repeat domain-containing protein [Planctomycetota bacterium]